MLVNDIVLEMSYYETIDSPAKSMTLAIADGTDFKYSLPLLGGERLTYSFSDSDPTESDNSISGRMILYKLANDRRIKRELNVYDLFMTTEEMFVDSQKIIDLSIKSMRVSDIVSQLFQDRIGGVGGKRLVTLDETEGLQSFVFNGGSPFTAINQLASEAQSLSKSSSSMFVFFENNEGYHFTTVESLFKKPPKFKYYYAEDRILGDDSTEKFRLTSMSHDSSFDLLSGVIDGQFGIRSSFIDPVTKTYGYQDYTMSDFGKVDRLGGAVRTISDSVVSKIGQNPVREKYMIADSPRARSQYIVDRDPSAQNIFRRRPAIAALEQATKAQLGSNTLKLAAYGNSMLRAGDVIEVFVPATGKRTPGEISNKSVSGKYLVTSLCHRLGVDGTYVSTMECARDSFNEPLETGRF